MNTIESLGLLVADMNIQIRSLQEDNLNLVNEVVRLRSELESKQEDLGNGHS